MFGECLQPVNMLIISLVSEGVKIGISVLRLVWIAVYASPSLPVEVEVKAEVVCL